MENRAPTGNGNSEDKARRDREQADRFRAQAEEPTKGLLNEFWFFLRHNKKWWLTPIIIILLLLALLLALGGTGAAPFIYTVF